MSAGAPDKQLEESKEIQNDLFDIDQELEAIKRQGNNQTETLDPQDLLNNLDD